jgi:hypothetical protein
MSLSRAHQVFTVELEDHLSTTHGPDNIRVHIGYCFAGDFKRKRPALRVSVILAELFKVIGYLTVNVRQTHLGS